MTRDRLFGSDIPLMAWCREKGKTGELPSYSEECGLVQTDVDAFWHRYKTCVDSLGTRDLQVFMEIECKTRGGSLTDSQADTYRKKHAMIQPQLKWHGQQLINFGVSVVRISGTTPDDSEWIKWGRFIRGKASGMKEEAISVDQLLKLMRFDMHPDTFNERPFRRHHKTRKFQVVETSALGFDVERELVNRS
jgi:hypothetical protein